MPRRVGRFTGDVLWNVGSLAFLALGGLLVNGLVVSLRGVEALGVFNQIYAFYTILSQIGVGGVQFSVLKHVSYVQSDLDVASETTTVALILVFALTLPLCGLGVLVADRLGVLLGSADVGVGVAYVMPGLIFYAANKVLINTLNGLRRMRIYAVFRAARFVFIPAFLIALIALDAPSNTLAASLTLAELALFLWLLIYLYTRVLTIRMPAHFVEYARAHLSYGVRGMLSGGLIELNTRTDVLILGLLLPDRVVGYYSFAAILAEGFAQIPFAVRNNVDPLIGDYFAKGQPERITDLARQIRRYFVPALALLGVGSILAYPLVYALAAGNDGLTESWLAYALLALIQVAVAAYSPMRGLLLQAGMPGTYTLIMLATFVSNALLNFLLIPVYGIVGSATATSISVFLEIALIVFTSRRHGVWL
jgi:O-antigen/teichoic acid export membrane protein